MKVISLPTTLPLPPVAASIGFFDGVHAGHRFLIAQLTEEASARGIASAVITFRNHPRKLLDPGFSPQLLSSYDEKIALLEQTGVDYCFVIDFTPEIQQLTAREFIHNILKKQFNTAVLIIGYDHRFGKNRSEGFEEYCIYGKECGVEVFLEQNFCPEGKHISSSAVRRALSRGDVKEAAILLGRPYNLRGVVESGCRIGRTIGFPTANIRPADPDKQIPASGVYAVRVLTEGNEFGGMLNIGVRPTVHDEGELSIEVNLFDFDGDLYGKEVNILFEAFIRDEKKMESLGQLIAQLEVDRTTALYLLAKGIDKTSDPR